MAESPRRSRPGPLIWRLVAADLRHEWLLSLCMVLAIASIMAPLLLLFGLKYGTIETFRQRLLENPKNREIRPLASQPYDQAWFDRVGAWPEVVFLMPHTRQMSASLDAYAENSSASAAPLSLEIIPSGPGDPWPAASNLPWPGENQALLSAPAAEALGVRAGSRLKVAVKRLKGSRTERADAELEIIGVFGEGGPLSPAIFTTLAFLEKVEAYKDGRGVPELGWAGDLPLAGPVFTGALLRSPEKLDPVMEFKAINNTGFVAAVPVGADRAEALSGRPHLPDGFYYHLQTKGEPARAENLLALAGVFRGAGADILPLAESLTVTLSGSGGEKKFTAVPDSYLPENAASAGGPLSPDLGPAARLKAAVVPGQWPSGPASMAFTGQATAEMQFPVTVEESKTPLAPDAAALPLSLLGVLAQADRRALTYEPDSQSFVLGRRSYAGFRLYARTLDDVAPLQKKFEDQGLKVSAESARIEEMKKLDKYLSLIFWLITTGAIVGAAASLLSNIYAGLERKRRELGVLRLLGISGFAFLRFPLYSSLALAAGGFLASWLLFTGLSTVINHLFRDHLRPGESLCLLTPEHIGAALAISLAIAALAGTAAALRAARIEPAEALRDE